MRSYAKLHQNLSNWESGKAALGASALDGIDLLAEATNFYTNKLLGTEFSTDIKRFDAAQKLSREADVYRPEIVNKPWDKLSGVGEKTDLYCRGHALLSRAEPQRSRRSSAVQRGTTRLLHLAVERTRDHPPTGHHPCRQAGDGALSPRCSPRGADWACPRCAGSAGPATCDSLAAPIGREQLDSSGQSSDAASRRAAIDRTKRCPARRAGEA